jgi:hypothetical protein
VTASTQDRSNQAGSFVLRIIDKEESSSGLRTELIYMHAQTTRDSRAVTKSANSDSCLHVNNDGF